MCLTEFGLRVFEGKSMGLDMMVLYLFYTEKQ